MKGHMLVMARANLEEKRIFFVEAGPAKSGYTLTSVFMEGTSG